MDEFQTGGGRMNVTLHIDGKPVTLEQVARKGGEVSFTLGGKSYHFAGTRLTSGELVLERLEENGVRKRHAASVSQGNKQTRVQVGSFEAGIGESKAAASAASDDAPLSPLAPMPGLVRQMLVKVGDEVKRNQPLVVMEAMKLQTTLSAGAAAKVEKILVKEGDLVTEGAELVRLKAL